MNKAGLKIKGSQHQSLASYQTAGITKFGPERHVHDSEQVLLCSETPTESKRDTNAPFRESCGISYFLQKVCLRGS